MNVKVLVGGALVAWGLLRIFGPEIKGRASEAGVELGQFDVSPETLGLPYFPSWVPIVVGVGFLIAARKESKTPGK